VRPTGSPPPVTVSLRRLTRTLTYEPDDLTIGVEAGTTLAELQAILARNGQLLPLDHWAPAEVTLGALVAGAAESPRRLGYGTMRDWVLALTVVEADGAVSRLGAQVVKNVTGYDLVKLFVGSRGTLGLIAAASLRVFPAPPATASCAIALPDRAAALALLDALAASRLQPTAAELLERVIAPPAPPAPAQEAAAICNLQSGNLQSWVTSLPAAAAPAFTALQAGGCILAVRAEGREEAVLRHMRELRALTARHGGASHELRAGDEETLWRAVAAHCGAPVAADELRMRLCAPPAELAAALSDADACAHAHGLRLSIAARALSGVAYLRTAGPADALHAFVAALLARRGHLHLLDGPPALLDALPRWGAAPPALGLMRALKAALDPRNLMNPGAYLV
jgi:D-lactate dehydrogenase (cytochrome)